MFEMFPFNNFNKDNPNKAEEFFPSLLRNFFDDDFFLKMDVIQGGFKVDLKENDKNYIVEADLPGIKKEFINIEIENNYLIITAKRDETIHEQNSNFIRKERQYGEFKRSFYVNNVDSNNITASFNDGVLKIILPKFVENGNEKREIDIL